MTRTFTDHLDAEEDLDFQVWNSEGWPVRERVIKEICISKNPASWEQLEGELREQGCSDADVEHFRKRWRSFKPEAAR